MRVRCILRGVTRLVHDPQAVCSAQPRGWSRGQAQDEGSLRRESTFYWLTMGPDKRCGVADVAHPGGNVRVWDSSKQQ